MTNWLLTIGGTVAATTATIAFIEGLIRKRNGDNKGRSKHLYRSHYSKKGATKAKTLLTQENITTLANKNTNNGYKLVVTQVAEKIHFGLLDAKNSYHDLYLFCAEYVPMPKDNVDPEKLETLQTERYWVSGDRNEKSYLVDWSDLL